MRHVHLTCTHHTELRWMCKEVAFTPGHGYNGSRHIFFNGQYVPERYETSWPYTMIIEGKHGPVTVDECGCSPKDLVFAPEELERQKTEPLEG